MTASQTTGLLLLTGGRGARLGGPKHDRPHPAGGSWGGRLAALHAQILGPGPVCILGAGLPDRPDLAALPDPGEGPAVALRLWAAQADVPPADRWWLVACDQVRWTAEALESWHRRAREADPDAAAWVAAEAGGRLQPLGGFLGDALRPALAAADATSMRALMAAVPHILLPADLPAWADVDTADALLAWEAEARGEDRA
jgi:molybdopterin-guanine dinucleotide biosynthesis protein A